MNIKRIVWIAVVAAALACAQTDAAKAGPKVIPIQHVDVTRLASLVSIPGAHVAADPWMRVLVVSGDATAVAAVEDLVKKLDIQPPPEPETPDFELTAYLIAGSSQPRAEEVPADLGAAVKQLRSIFSYKSYRVMDTFVIHGATNRGSGRASADASGILPGTYAQYSFRYNGAALRAGSPAAVRFDNLSLYILTPTAERDKDGKTVMSNVGIRTDVEVPEGQRVVVGKSHYAGSDDALILVLSVKILK